jgi:hypothetical protein
LKQEGHCVKGYYSKDFTEAFERYLPERRNPVTNADNLNSNKHLEGYGSVTVTSETRNRADFLFEEEAI